MDQKETKDYELSFLTVEPDAARAVLGELKKRNAEILLEGPVDLITLAYKIQKVASAYFGYLHFRLPPEEITPLREELESNPKILRFLIITPPFAKAKPKSAVRAHERTAPPPIVPTERKAPPSPLSNEALEKKIEEILK